MTIKKKKKNGFQYKRGKITSGERKVLKFLKDNKVKYLREVTFKDLINPITGNHLYFDFYIPKNRLIIEVQGDQHFRYIPDFHKNKEQFAYQQTKDQFKRTYCLQHNYKLVAIDYSQVGNLSFLLELLKQ